MDLRFYLEIPWPESLSVQPPSTRQDINLFFKYYDPEAETLKYVGHRYVPRNLKVSQRRRVVAVKVGMIVCH